MLFGRMVVEKINDEAKYYKSLRLNLWNITNYFLGDSQNLKVVFALWQTMRL